MRKSAESFLKNNNENLFKMSTSKFHENVVNEKLQHTNYLFFCVACFTFLFTFNKICRNEIIAYATIFMLKISAIISFRRYSNLTSGIVVCRVEQLINGTNFTLRSRYQIITQWTSLFCLIDKRDNFLVKHADVPEMYS